MQTKQMKIGLCESGRWVLANRCFKPLSHLSDVSFQQVNTVLRFSCCTFAALYAEKTGTSKDPDGLHRVT